MEFPSKKNQWPKGTSGNPDGRPKKTVSQVNAMLEAEGYQKASSIDICDAYMLLISLDPEKLKEIEADSMIPILYKKAAKIILSDKGFDIIEKMLDRAHGRPKQTNELTGANGNPLFDNIKIEIIEQSKDTGK